MIDNGQNALLVLLDLSDTFDTFDHHLLLTRLQSNIEIHDLSFDWFKSYLTDRSQAV